MRGGDVFLDTNILLYAYDTTSSKSIKARRFISMERRTVKVHISAQVLNEFSSAALTKFSSPIPLERLSKLMDVFIRLFIVEPLTGATCTHAIDLKERHGFSLWDSLIVASALEARCSILYTEDLEHGQIIDRRLKVVNPFKL